jgi:hypothetical protein
MITTKNALNALKEKGVIADWHMANYREDDLAWKSPVVKSDKVNVSNETYGKTSFLYFRAKTPELAKEIATTLKAVGGNPDFGWCADDPKCFDLQVSRFNGYHWWE